MGKRGCNPLGRHYGIGKSPNPFKQKEGLEMKIEYAIFKGERCISPTLHASSMKEINEVIADLNINGDKFTSFIVRITAGV